MDRAAYKVLTYGAIGLAVAYVYFHYDSITYALRMALSNWWH